MRIALVTLLLFSFLPSTAKAVITLSPDKTTHEIDISKQIEKSELTAVQIFISRDAFEGCFSIEVAGYMKKNISLGEFCPYQVEFEKDGQPLSLSKTFKMPRSMDFPKQLVLTHLSGKPIEILEVRMQAKIYGQSSIYKEEKKPTFPIKIPTTKVENVVKREVRLRLQLEKPDVEKLYVTPSVDGKNAVRGAYLYVENRNTYESISFMLEPGTEMDLQSVVLDGQARKLGPLANTKVNSVELTEEVTSTVVHTIYK